MKGKRLKHLSKVFLFLLLPLQVFAIDAGQALPYQIQDDTYGDSVEYQILEDETIMDKADLSLDKSSHFFPSVEEGSEFIALPQHLRSKSEDVLENPSSGGYYSFREKDEVRKYGNMGKTDFSFFFLEDSFDYSDRNDIFKRTFETGDDGIKGGMLLFSLNKYLSRTLLFNTKIGMNFGFGFNQGDGFFVPDPSGNVDQSTVQLKVWTVPIELNLGAEFNFTKYLKLQGSAGPSFMVLLQHRGDKEDDSSLRELRQLGYGYFALVAAKISLSDIFQSSVGYQILTTYNMSKMSFDLYVKHQNISGFKNEDITISGTSVGFGFSFEYL